MIKINIRQEKRFTDYQSKKADMLKADIPIKNKLLIRKTLRPLLRCMLRIQRKFNHFHVELLNEIKYTNKAVIYAVTHIGKWDFEIINEQIAKPFYILAADFININKGFNGLFMKLNGVVYVNEKSNIDRHNTSVGYPILGKAIVSAFDIETNSELKYGERGEIRAITPAHMKGYFNNEEATSEFFKEDSKGQIWACTGDIGYVDEEGYLFILGRSTDSYKSDSGRVIYLFDAEQVILKDKNISLCKVIDTTYKSKKVSAAHIILKSDENINEVIKRLYLNCTESLPADEVPQLWKIRKTMPVHKSGKRDVEALKNECSGYYDSEGNIIESIR